MIGVPSASTTTLSALVFFHLAACTFSGDPAFDPAFEKDNGEAPDSGGVSSCSTTLEGPFGIQVDEVLPSAVLSDCEGNPVELQGLCDKKASWMFHFAGW